LGSPVTPAVAARFTSEIYEAGRRNGFLPIVERRIADCGLEDLLPS